MFEKIVMMTSAHNFHDPYLSITEQYTHGYRLQHNNKIYIYISIRPINDHPSKAGFKPCRQTLALRP